LGGAHEPAQALDPLGRETGLALLRGHDLLALRDLAESVRHRTAMPARSDDERSLEAPTLGGEGDGVRALLHGRDAEAPAHVGAGGGRALEEIVIELAADDAEAGRARPRRLVPRSLELEDAGLEGLDGERILLGIDLQVTQGFRGDPARADLD